MAVIPPVITQLQSLYGHTTSVVWTPVTNADTCGAVQMSQMADRSIHAFGTFGSATVAVQGSNESTGTEANVTSFVALHDAQGTAIALTSAKIDTIAEVTNWVKPTFSGGDGTQSLSVAMVFRSVL